MSGKAIGLTVAVLLAAGCASAQTPLPLGRSGFLGDYSPLGPAGSGRRVERWANETADWSRYTGVYIEPVQVWALPGSELAEIEEHERKALVDYLHAVMAREIGRVMRVLDRPDDDTAIRLRLALTGAEALSEPVGTVSSAVPVGHASRRLDENAQGRAAYVSAASVEAELIDARSGVLLALSVDGRIRGRDREPTAFWADARGAFDFWASDLATFIREQR